MYKEKEGFTLVEIIVVLAISAVLLGASVPLILSGNQVFKKNADMSHGTKILQQTIDWLEDYMAYSSVVYIVDNADPVPAGFHAIKLQGSGPQEGQLMFYKEGVWGYAYNPGYYEGWRIAIKPSVLSQRLQLEVEIRNREDIPVAASTKIISFPNYKNLQDNRDNPNDLYPMFLISLDVELPEIQVPPPGGGDDEEYINTTTSFAIGGNPNFIGESAGEIGVYLQDNRSGPGTSVPDGTVLYALEGYLTPFGEVLEGAYYITRNSQYVRVPFNEEKYYEYLYGILRQGNQYVQGTAYGQKINIDVDPENMPTPGIHTQPGDLKREGDRFFVFFPYARYNNDYRDANYWKEISMTK